MKIKYLMKFFEGLPGLQANIPIAYPRYLFLSARYFFPELNLLNSKQFVLTNY